MKCGIFTIWLPLAQLLFSQFLQIQNISHLDALFTCSSLSPQSPFLPCQTDQPLLFLLFFLITYSVSLISFIHPCANNCEYAKMNQHRAYPQESHSPVEFSGDANRSKWAHGARGIWDCTVGAQMGETKLQCLHLHLISIFLSKN